MTQISRTKKLLVFVFSAIFILACGISFDTGGSTPAPADPQSPNSQPNPQVPDPVLPPTYTPQPTFTPQPTYTLQPTFTPQATFTDMPTQAQDAMFTANEPAFCRTGPSEQIWWDPQEALNAGQTVKIIGKSTEDWGLWWYIQKASGSRCWVYSELGSTSGNIAGVPIKSAPSTPVPTIVNATLKNNHGGPLCAIWITDSGNANWVNLLEGWQLEAGQVVNFTAWPGIYDIEIYDCTNTLVDAGYGTNIDSNNRKFATP